MFFTPSLGIKTNPAKKVPKILPIVDNADILPETLPISSMPLSFSFTANGDAVAKNILGIPNVTVEQIIAINDKSKFVFEIGSIT